jgi:hypothetical protein
MNNYHSIEQKLILNSVLAFGSVRATAKGKALFEQNIRKHIALNYNKEILN